MRQRQPVVFAESEYAHREAADRAGDAIAIKVERRPIRGTDVLRAIHFHAVDDGEEIVLAQRKLRHRALEPVPVLRSVPGIERVDIVAPAREVLEPPGMRRIAIGDVVDGTAEAIDLEHRLALRLRQDAHGEIERAAARSLGHTPLFLRKTQHRGAHGLAAENDGAAMRQMRRDRIRSAPAPLVNSISDLRRCTVSLSGSRNFRKPIRRSASAWIAEISMASRVSWVCIGSGRLSVIKRVTRSTSPRRQRNRASPARGALSASTPSPTADSTSSGT